MYYFLSGYTAKVAGTERGVTEPQATFSACFGAVFLVWHPTKYANMLGELLEQHTTRTCWLVNTGWSGGAVRRGRAHEARRTRARWCARRSRASSTACRPRSDPVFGLAVPTAIDGVPAGVLDAARARGRTPAAYDAQATKLARNVPEEHQEVRRRRSRTSDADRRAEGVRLTAS